MGYKQRHRQSPGESQLIAKLRMQAQIGLLGAISAVFLFAVPSFAAIEAGPRCDGKKPTIVGTDGRDRIFDTPGADVISAGSGKDFVRAGRGLDRVCLGAGDDRARMVKRFGSSIVVGGGGSDSFKGGAQEFRGGGGNDRISDSWGVFIGGPGDDEAVGLPGPPAAPTARLQMSFEDSNKAIRADLERGSIHGLGTDRVSGPIILYGSPRDDTIVGSSGGDWIESGAGADSILAGGGDDSVRAVGAQARIDAGGGDDRISGGDGAQELIGGAGDDLLTGGRDNDRLLGNEGVDELIGDVPDPCDPVFVDPSLNCQTVFGDDFIDGGDGADIASGGGQYTEDVCVSVYVPAGCEVVID